MKIFLKRTLRTCLESLPSTAVNGGFSVLRCSRMSNTLRCGARKFTISNSSQQDSNQVLSKKYWLILVLAFFYNSAPSLANPIISGISTNEINIDTKFRGTDILLFGAKGDAGNIVIAVRGPKKNFIVSKKEKFLGIWHNGQRLKIKDSYSYYSLFSTFNDASVSSDLRSLLELGKNNLKFNFSEDVSEKKKEEFQMQMIEKFEKNKLYSTVGKVDFLDETLFKVMLHFPKNISRGIYVVEIYLINEDNLVSFQSIPIYVNQVGLSARILDFSHQQSFLYGIISVVLALGVGWLASYLFVRFVGK